MFSEDVCHYWLCDPYTRVYILHIYDVFKFYRYFYVTHVNALKKSHMYIISNGKFMYIVILAN